jgi:tRNA (mo5U34)-methyltransferase
MDRSEDQRRIDEIDWYHEFDFPDGLVARSRTPDIELHRRIWSFIASELDKIDFRGKTVLDLGCWDGYWSFYAERRGARSVLATDDRTQNWAGSSGVLLAKDLLSSSIDAQLDVSVYDLTRLGRTFDIVLCLGIYYHLIDPFYAFSQVRQCCHPGSVAVFEGDYSRTLAKTSIHYDLAEPALPIFVPSQEVLAQMLEASYFRVAAQTPLIPARPKRKSAWKRIWPKRAKEKTALQGLDRVITVCRPVEGVANPLHYYKPPFGLHRYDARFRESSGAELPRCARFATPVAR